MLALASVSNPRRGLWTHWCFFRISGVDPVEWVGRLCFCGLCVYRSYATWAHSAQNLQFLSVH
jgi:hypothetical protein